MSNEYLVVSSETSSLSGSGFRVQGVPSSGFLNTSDIRYHLSDIRNLIHNPYLYWDINQKPGNAHTGRPFTYKDTINNTRI